METLISIKNNAKIWLRAIVSLSGVQMIKGIHIYKNNLKISYFMTDQKVDKAGLEYTYFHHFIWK